MIIMPHRVTGHGAEVLDGKWISPSRTGQLKLGDVRSGSKADHNGRTPGCLLIDSLLKQTLIDGLLMSALCQ